MPVAALKGLPMTKERRKSIQDKASRPKLHKPNGRLVDDPRFLHRIRKARKTLAAGRGVRSEDVK